MGRGGGGEEGTFISGPYTIKHSSLPPQDHQLEFVHLQGEERAIINSPIHSFVIKFHKSCPPYPLTLAPPTHPSPSHSPWPLPLTLAALLCHPPADTSPALLPGGPGGLPDVAPPPVGPSLVPLSCGHLGLLSLHAATLLVTRLHWTLHTRRR